ncbi:MAG: UvrD-helicase domain-containing protein, partial [Bacteroidota bacterium]
MSVYLTIASLVLFFSFVGWYYLQIKKNRNFFHSTKDKLESAIEAFEEATNGTYFFNHRKANKWRSDNLSLINAIRNHSNLFGLSDSFKVDLRKTNRYFSELESIRNSYNNLFIRKEKVKFKSLFDNVEKYPLDEQQKTAIVHDEDNTLIIAGAGTGKTSTIVGKAAYLIEKGLARPNDLLLISFTKKSAEELGERIKERIGKEVKVKTFNALGYEIIGKVEGAKPDLAFDGNDKAVKNFLNSVLLKMKEDKRLLESLIIFFAYHLVPEKEENHFKSLGEYYQYVKDFELRTLKDERVKSFEELKIANFLYINGINYEYEANFEPVQRDSRFKIYSPDFYLPDYDITIEHFGVNRNGDVPHFFRGKNGVSARDIYWQGIRWKRGTHKFHNKKLIETYSYEYREGTLFDNLQKNLEKENVSFNRIDNEKIFENIKRHQQTPFLIDLICTFLSLVKSNHLSIKELRKRVVIIGDARSSAFLAIFETFFEAYENYLTNKSLIDFNDMLIVASDYIRTNQYRHPYKYVMVDEFQDMSVGRYNLLKSMTDQNPDLKLFCVGDDWQSIYRFTGSDISLTTQFEKYFGYTYKGKIETTYRFNDKILEFTSDFIQKNPYQIKKNLKAKTLYPDGIPFEI